MHTALDQSAPRSTGPRSNTDVADDIVSISMLLVARAACYSVQTSLLYMKSASAWRSEAFAERCQVRLHIVMVRSSDWTLSAANKLLELLRYIHCMLSKVHLLKCVLIVRACRHTRRKRIAHTQQLCLALAEQMSANHPSHIRFAALRSVVLLRANRHLY